MILNFLTLLRFSPGDRIIPWMAHRKILLLVSAAFMAISVLSMGLRGMNFGIDFTGGALVELQTKGPADLASMRERASSLDNVSSIQLFGAEDLVLVRISSENLDEKALNAQLSVLRGLYTDSIIEVRRAELVGATISDELTQNSLIAVIVALLLIAIYIWLRFEWQLGLTAIAALLHDVVVVLGVYSIFGISFSISTVAAILAVAGYSINDTVVLFDRVREVRRKYKKPSLVECIERAVQEVLSRTFMTSFTTLLAVTALLIFGGAVLRDFLWALFAGVIFGTWSSVAVATTLLCFFKNIMHHNVDE